MIALPSGVRVFLDCGVTDMRKGMTGLAMLLQQGQFVWPSATSTGRIALSAPQLAALLDGIDWRGAPSRPRPQLAG